jgi:2-keto-4-pentenoate hydratase/2-oxohepta-3-ene-1,7-dioic acid hydratase in catechol pathway
MRLVTYDRRGHRRLGAILGGEVVDLPDLVGHPAFPTTLETLVASSGGTVMDAARAALERDEAARHVVTNAHILPPLFPTSLLMPDASGVERRIVGPEQDVPWPAGAAWIDYEPKVAAVLGLETAQASIEEVQRKIFGYTLVSDWAAHDASGDPMATAEGLPLAIGPCVVTAGGFDPQTIVVQVKVDGDEVAKGNLNGAAANLFELISEASRFGVLERGDAFALGPFGGPDDLDPSRRLWPGALIELAAEGIGTLRNRLAPRS